MIEDIGFARLSSMGLIECFLRVYNIGIMKSTVATRYGTYATLQPDTIDPTYLTCAPRP